MNKEYIPTVFSATASTFKVHDVVNTFERDIKRQHDVNYKNYIKSQLAK